MPIECAWFETGNSSDFIAATSTCLEKLCSPKMPSSDEYLYLQRLLKTWAPDLVLNSEIRSLISNQAVVGKNASISQSVIGPHINIPIDSVIEKSVIVSNAILKNHKYENEIVF
jgi:NDP-sugar pyrophosphorylase family protein